MENEKKLTASQKAAQKKYDEKTKTISVKYTPVDMEEYEKLKEHLDESGLSANQFIKNLIHEFLTAPAKMTECQKPENDEVNAEVALSEAAKTVIAEENPVKKPAKRGAVPEWFD